MEPTTSLTPDPPARDTESEQTDPAAEPSLTAHPLRLRLSLGMMLLLVASLAPVFALYAFLARDTVTGISDEVNVVVLGVILTGVAVGILRRASSKQAAIQIALAAGVLLALFETANTRASNYFFSALFAVTVVAPLLVTQWAGALPQPGPWRRRAADACRLGLNVFLNVVACSLFVAANSNFKTGFYGFINVNPPYTLGIVSGPMTPTSPTPPVPTMTITSGLGLEDKTAYDVVPPPPPGQRMMVMMIDPGSYPSATDLPPPLMIITPISRQDGTVTYDISPPPPPGQTVKVVPVGDSGMVPPQPYIFDAVIPPPPNG